MQILNYLSKKIGSVTIETDENKITMKTRRLELLTLNQVHREEWINSCTRLLANPENVALLANGKVWSREQVIKLLNEELDQLNQNNSLYTFAIYHITHKQFIGLLFTERFPSDFSQFFANKHANAAEIGYVLDNEYWGRGYGTEAAIAGKKYIKHLVLTNQIENPPSEIVATAHPDNLGSRRILEKTLKRQEPEIFTRYYNPRMLFYKPLKPQPCLALIEHPHPSNNSL